MKIRIAGIVNDSIVDGPGFRLTIFTQGCPHHCPGCHNPQTHDFSGGREEETAKILDQMRENPLLDGITLSGGEPFCQSGACAEIARGARAAGLNVWCYTGYTFEELVAGKSEWMELLREIDVLVDGRFILEKKTLECRFRGSSNQRLIDVKKSLKAGAAIEIS
ncbi:MAG: anaerobic ribonucleoside-triphosphate reductase activating protein [Clostridia bacterium]|nr:anaerobic ribonucleoside-triphosphate reductase activating protein [Clostridia bacterium]